MFKFIPRWYQKCVTQIRACWYIILYDDLERSLLNQLSKVPNVSMARKHDYSGNIETVSMRIPLQGADHRMPKSLEATVSRDSTRISGLNQSVKTSPRFFRKCDRMAKKLRKQNDASLNKRAAEAFKTYLKDIV